MTLEEYLKKRSGSSNGDPLFTDSLCVKEVDDEERSVTAVISTDRIDRMKEVLLPKGAKIDEFLKNPVVPWAHNSHEPPVGRSLWITKKKGSMISKVKFAATERAEEIWQLFRQGFLKAFSVGFKPIKGHAPTPDEIKKKPEWAEADWIFDEWELLEFSPVTIPANPDALAIAVKSNDITLSEEMRKELKVIEDDIEETFYAEGEKAEVLEDGTDCNKEIEINVGFEEEKPEEDKGIDVDTFTIGSKEVAAKVLPVTVNPDPHPEAVYNVSSESDVAAVKVDHNIDVERVIEGVEKESDVNIVYEVDEVIEVKLPNEEIIKAAHDEFLKKKKGTVWI